MKHVRTISACRPSLAQFEGVLQLLSVLSALLGLAQGTVSFLGQLETFLGIDFSEKNATT